MFKFEGTQYSARVEQKKNTVEKRIVEDMAEWNPQSNVLAKEDVEDREEEIENTLQD